MQLQLEKSRMRICERNHSADTKVSGEGGGGGGGAPGTRPEIPLQSVVKTMVEQAVLLQPMEGNGSAEIHLQPMEETHARVELKGGCEPLGSPCWTRVLAGTCRPLDTGVHAGPGFLVGLVTLWGTHAEAGYA
ncbi:protein pxr1-like [Pitangus sulphuratus]|nr:protein pxr1-like [Pitangus sulphuratus]